MAINIFKSAQTMHNLFKFYLIIINIGVVLDQKSDIYSNQKHKFLNSERWLNCTEAKFPTNSRSF